MLRLATFIDLNPRRLALRFLVAYAVICLFMWVCQRSLLYIPMHDARPPQAYGLQGFQALQLAAQDGTRLSAWYHPPQADYPTILYFHGNGGNLGTRAEYFHLLTAAGFGLLGIDYRGYGGSEGSPTEQGVYQDARATVAYARNTLNLPPSRMIFYGESLGTGVAVQMADEYPSAALVLQSPFTSLRVLAETYYPWLPVRLLLKDQFDSLSKITRIHTPLLLLHGTDDTVVPVESGKALFAAAPHPKQAVYYAHRGHADLDMKALVNALRDFCVTKGLIKNSP